MGIPIIIILTAIAVITYVLLFSPPNDKVDSCSWNYLLLFKSPCLFCLCVFLLVFSCRLPVITLQLAYGLLNLSANK